MVLQGFQGLDMVGLVSVLVVATAMALFVYYLYCNTTKESYNLNPLRKQQHQERQNGSEEEPEPVNTAAPYSNAPVKGQAKEMIVPRGHESAEEERTAMFTLSNEPVVRWDLVPMSAKIVTFGVRVANPPSPEGNDPGTAKPLVTSIPASAGIYLGYMGNQLKIDVGKQKNLQYDRPNAYWNRRVEVIEIRLTQVNASTTRVELLFNGKDKVLTSEQFLPVSNIRAWPQRIKVFDTNQIQNVWVTYGS